MIIAGASASIQVCTSVRKILAFLPTTAYAVAGKTPPATLAAR
jgi:hypothetical protein